MTTNKVCGKGKCKFTDEFCVSGDCPYDPDVLKNNKIFNILEGNVKDDDINVANNVAQRNMQDLTELWKKGKLEDGLYYCKLACFNYEPTVAKCKSGCIGLASFSKNEEVLAPVPSYKEWQQMKAFCEEFNALNVAEENKKLKELLKEWMHYYPIVLYEHEDTLKTKDIIELYDKTREVLK